MDDVRVVKAMEISGFQLKEMIYSPTKTPKHLHECASLGIVLEGGCTEVYSGRTREHSEFMLHFFPPDYSHSVSLAGMDLHSFDVEIPGHWMDELHGYSKPLLDSFHSFGGPLMERYLRLYREFRQPDDVSTLVIEGLMLEILAEVVRQTKGTDRTPPRWLIQARELLDAHFAEHLMLETIAASVDMHPIHLVREFRKHFDCTIGEYVRRKRIEYVCRQLVESESSLVEISIAAGFCDQSHLSRVFKRFVGVTPGEYRTAVIDRAGEGPKGVKTLTVISKARLHEKELRSQLSDERIGLLS